MNAHYLQGLSKTAAMYLEMFKGVGKKRKPTLKLTAV